MNIRQSLLGRRVIGLLLASCVMPVGANAQKAVSDEAPASASSFESSGEIVVSARRRDERLQDVPAAISVVGEEHLQKYSVTTMSDIGKMVPQLFVSKTASGTNSSLTIRGIGSPSFSGGFEQSVSVNIDGIQISRGNAIQIGYLDLGQLSVIKGPQALYYGKNSTAGILSMQTQDPGPGQSLSGAVGYEIAKRQHYAEFAGSTPLTDSLRARLAVRYSGQDGFFLNKAVAHTEPALPGIIEPGAQSPRGEELRELSGRLTLVYDDGGDFTARVKAFANRSRGTPVPRQLWRCFGANGQPQPLFGVVNTGDDCKVNRVYAQSPVPPDFFPGWTGSDSGELFQKVDAQLVSVDLAYDFGGVTLSSLSGYFHYDADIQFDSAGGVIWAAERQNYTAFSEELRLATHLEGPFDFVLGGYYQHTRLPHNIVSRNAPSPVDPETGKYQSFEKYDNVKSTTLSAFAEVIWDIVPGVELDGGVRWTRERKSVIAVQPYVHPSRRGALSMNEWSDDKFTDENFSPQVTLTYRPTSDLTIYGAYKTGFKSGGYNTTAFMNPGVPISTQRFNAEKARGFEGGLKFLLDDGRLSINTAIYDFKFTDLQVLVYDSANNVFLTRNAGELNTRGVEVDAVWSLGHHVDGLHLRGSISYNHARYGNYIGPCYSGQRPSDGCDQLLQLNGAYAGQIYSGKAPPRAPAWAGSFGGDFRQPVTDTMDFELSLDARYTGSFNTSDGLRPDAVQKSYVLLDGSIRMISDSGWQLALIGRNLTNQYVVYVGGDQPLTGANTGRPDGILSDLNAIVGTGREVAIEARFSF